VPRYHEAAEVHAPAPQSLPKTSSLLSPFLSFIFETQDPGSQSGATRSIKSFGTVDLSIPLIQPITAARGEGEDKEAEGNESVTAVVKKGRGIDSQTENEAIHGDAKISKNVDGFEEDVARGRESDIDSAIEGDKMRLVDRGVTVSDIAVSRTGEV
jgi:hypothetical protein